MREDLRRQFGDVGVSKTLWHHGQTDSDAGDDVALEMVQSDNRAKKLLTPAEYERLWCADMQECPPQFAETNFKMQREHST